MNLNVHFSYICSLWILVITTDSGKSLFQRMLSFIYLFFYIHEASGVEECRFMKYGIASQPTKTPITNVIMSVIREKPLEDPYKRSESYTDLLPFV